MDYEKLLLKKDFTNGFIEHLGIEIVQIGEGCAKGEIEISEVHRNVIGSVHGGCIYSLADTVTGVAAASYGTYMTTVSGNMNYLSPALKIKKLTGEARAIKHGKTLTVFDVDIYDENKNLLANGCFTYFNLNKPIGGK